MLLTWLAIGLASAAVGAAEPAKPPKPPARLRLTVNVTELRNERGKVAVALFNSERDFPDQERAFRGRLTKIAGGRARVTFDDLPPGVYAVAMLHDENENSKMDFNFLGMPLEGYGFSRDAPVLFGPPDFEDAAFRLRAAASAISIKARYFSL